MYRPLQMRVDCLDDTVLGLFIPGFEIIDVGAVSFPLPT